MLMLILAAILAGGVLSCIENLFILLTCGPYWMGFGIFLLTWLVYSLSILVGLIILHGIFSILPLFKSKIKNRNRRFFLYYLISWAVGCILLTVIVGRDLDAAYAVWPLIIISLVIGLLSLLILTRLIKGDNVSLNRPLWLVVGFVLLFSSVYISSDLFYSASLEDRNHAYRGTIPHLCLIVLDTTRGDHFSCYGYPFRTTRHMDKIAAEGLLCEKAFSASNWTPPGHIATFTGKYPSQHANNGQPYTPDDLVTITEILRGEGYYCIALYNNPLAGNNINLTQGFDCDIGVYRHSWVYPAWQRLIDKLIYDDSGSKRTFRMALKASEWVQRKGGHLFLYLNLVEPHADYKVHQPYVTEFTDDLDLTAIPNLGEVKGLCNYIEKVIYDSTRFARYNADSYRYLRAVYDGELAYMDEQFAAYGDGMRQSGLLDSTLLVITADHGEFLGEHYTRGHPDIMYNPVLRIPLMLRYPRLIPPSLEKGYTSNVDVLPTTLTLMGYSMLIPDDVQGVDLLVSENLDGRRILSERINFDEGCRSLIDGSYKLILNTDQTFLEKYPFDTLLVDLVDDPQEIHDIHSEQSELLHGMSEHLDQWVRDIEVVPAEDIELSEETINNLRALGYVH